MTQTAKNIFNDALKLGPVEKAELIEQLFLSFDKKSRKSIETKWKHEVEDRVKAYDAGKISADSFENVMERLGKRRKLLSLKLLKMSLLKLWTIIIYNVQD